MPNPNPRPLIEGRAVLIVIDIQKDSFVEADLETGERSIPIMDGYAERMLKSKVAIDKARDVGIPIVFIREAHRPDLVDFGRELDGDETVHCIETDPNNQLAIEELGILPSDYRIKKRRYSAFFGTDLEILLKGLKAETLLLCGGLTDVCVHYTFVDGHQHDYFCRVIEDCVGGSSLEAHEASLKAMEYLQTGARRSLDEVTEAISEL